MDTKALAISHLVKRYNKGPQALKGIDLSVSHGDFFALLGPNGAGKSTTISIISTLTHKTEGRVQVYGHDLDVDPLAVKKCIGVVPQEFNFSIFDTVENIVINQAGYYGIPYKQAKLSAAYFLKKLDLWDKRHTQAMKLSGGMKRRLMIARGMVHEPKLLLLDEPTAGVDVEMRRLTWDFLRSINEKGVTIILTTHYLEEAEALCRHTAIIDEGIIKATGSISELVNKMEQKSFVIECAKLDFELPVLDGYSLTADVKTDTLNVTCHGPTHLTPILMALGERKADILAVRPQSNRLEDYFLNMVKSREPSDV